MGQSKVLCLHRSKSVFPALKLSSSVAAAEDLVHRASGVVYLDTMHEHFPLMNEIGLTFEDLCSVEKVYQNAD